jgi:DNA repair exonuclease SbcCD ATPase subunit
MKLTSLQLRKFFSFDQGKGKEDDLTFPSGVTVLVGMNGAGKTAAGLEATCWLLWGKTTRGTVPDGDIVGGFDVGGTTYAVSRERKSKKTTLALLDTGIGAGPTVDLTGQTVTETQGKIDEVFGSWDRFCAERVFSNRLARRFGSSTDKERKALVESILGLERHERAAQEARDELGRRKNLLQNARVEVAGASAARAEAERHAMAALAAAAGAEGLGDIRRRREQARAREEAARLELVAKRAAVEGIARRLQAVQKTVLHLEAEERSTTAAKARVDRQLAELRSKAKTSLEMGDCPVCLTPAKDVPREKMREHFAAELKPLMAERDALAAKLASRVEVEEARADAAKIEAERAKVLAEAAATEREWSTLGEGARRLESALAAAEQVESRQKDAAEAVARAKAVEAQLHGAEEAAEMACLVAEAAVKALGPRGARVRKMNGALARLTAEANAILARMPVDGTGPLRLSIRGSRELASGKEVDEVSVRVDGAGGPEGEYDGASDGERTRLDVAIMLGLARLSGPGEGLVVFDELFDPLDDAGLEAIVEVLGELAVTRQVVVTTHNPRFLDRVPSSSVWKVSRDANGTSRIDRADGPG